MNNLLELQSFVIEGDKAGVEKAVQQALADGIPADKILNDGLIEAMNEVGLRFENGDFFVPEMLIAARAMQAGLALLKPYLVQGGIQARGKVVIGTVKGDLHDIGKNLVAMMLEGAGFEVVDLGTDVSPEKYVQAVKDHQANIVGMSALLTTTMSNMKMVINSLEQAGLRSYVKVMVGGAPVTDTFAREIGADGYAPDASRAVALAKSFV
ncbi:MAG: corrinoid protein [Anaerolineales bacterium]|jgi:5-methyltetrahydrofolate--homocysteine methyltransferase|nr:corrinoid protein [Anaerolineales bacterium]